MHTAQFISVEGNEGVGKTTAIQYIAHLFTQYKQPYMLTREPGGTEIAEKIRRVLLDSYQEKMADETELLLMFAARAQHVATVIKPALAEKKWVISDRFVDASYAYQSGGRQLSPTRLKMLDDWVLQGFKPGLTLLLDAPVEVCLSRMRNRGGLDRIENESIAFFERVRETYLMRAKAEPKRFVLIDTNCALEKVKSQIAKAFESYGIGQ